MICAVVRDDIVDNVIVIDEDQIETMQKALDAELVDARPYGLAIGDLRTPRGWTRNAGGEQMLLPELEQEQYDSYTVAMEQRDAAENEKNAVIASVEARAQAVAEAALQDLITRQDEEDEAMIELANMAADAATRLDEQDAALVELAGMIAELEGGAV